MKFKIIYLALAFVLVFSMAAAIVPADSASAQVVNFPDFNLELAIRDAIGKPTEDILQSDLDGLSYLYVQQRDIVDLTGLEHCTSLIGLGLSENLIMNIYPIQGLTNLRNLYLDNNLIGDPFPLAGLFGLEQLWIGANPLVSNLWALAAILQGLPNLYELRLDNWSNNNYKVNDLTPLLTLTNLTWLSLVNNQISSLPSMSGLNLYSIDIRYNPILDFTPLSTLSQLRDLTVGGGEVDDLALLDIQESVPNLTSIYLENCRLTDISPIGYLSNLTSLNMWGTLVNDISPLVSLSNLSSLGIGKSTLSDISPLADFINLHSLSLWDNHITDIQAIVDNPGISEGDSVYIYDNPLNANSIDNYVLQLEDRGVFVFYSMPNTPVGSSVSVDVLASYGGSPGIFNVIFDNVSAKGHTLMDIYGLYGWVYEAMPEWGPIPPGVSVVGPDGPVFFDIVTGASYNGLITLENHLPLEALQEEPDISGLRFFHWDGTQWNDVTTGVDNENGIMYGEVSSLGFLFMGVLDGTQVNTATGTGTATLLSSSGTIEGLTAVAESSLPEEASASKPNINFPHGLFEFNITGLDFNEEVTLTITYPDNIPTNAEYWKWGPTPVDPTYHWYTIPMGSNNGDNVITITLQDNWFGDDFLTGPDGEIVDQGGPGWPATTGVPVFPTWYIGIVAALGAGVLAYLYRRRVSGRKMEGM